MNKMLHNILPCLRKCHTLINFTVLALCLCVTGCGNVAASSKNTETEAEFSQIDSFRGYKWGTSGDVIKENEITPDMKEILDYTIETDAESGLEGITVVDGYVDSYDAQIGYIFSDGVLVAGGYELDVNDDNYEDICKGISEKYGEPFISKESTGWGPCSIWIDENSNFISVSGILDILYVQSGSPFLDMQVESFERFHEIDLLRELDKAGDNHVGY